MRLKRIRQVAACICFVLVTLLFLDFTGVVQGWFGWLAKIQFIPALLALNFGVVVALVLLTCVFGRVYCSVICPLGVFQDVVSRMGGKYKKNRFRYSPALSWLRYGVLALFVAVCGAGLWAGVTGLMGWAGLLEPYSAYGRMASNLLAPFYRWGNNLLAYMAERMDSYAFYEVEVWMKGLSVLGVALLTFVVLSVLAWRNGRTYCNTICPVGTLLGFLSRYAWLKPVIDTSKCVNCNLCERNCKASCIHIKEHKIDYSRCVACMNCIDKCPKGAIRYVRPSAVAQVDPEKGGADNGRRSFLAVASWFAAGSWIRAQEKKVDGGLAVIEEKKIPERKVHLKPAGAQGVHNFASHCTACQLCVSACPNDVFRDGVQLLLGSQVEGQGVVVVDERVVQIVVLVAVLEDGSLKDLALGHAHAQAEVTGCNVADDDLQRHDLDLLHKGVAVIDLLHVMGGDALLLELLHQSVGQLVVDNALVANGALLLTVTGSGVILVVDHDDLGIVGSENLLGLAFVQLLFNFVIHEKRSFL